MGKLLFCCLVVSGPLIGVYGKEMLIHRSRFLCMALVNIGMVLGTVVLLYLIVNKEEMSMLRN